MKLTVNSDLGEKVLEWNPIFHHVDSIQPLQFIQSIELGVAEC
jgi:hypothetical protein